MSEAIATLKRTARHRNFLYELPWYVVIGPPGAGKTTALVNSGLRFPLAGSGEAQPVSGVGGTRYCDWWFTEDAVIVVGTTRMSALAITAVKASECCTFPVSATEMR